MPVIEQVAWVFVPEGQIALQLATCVVALTFQERASFCLILSFHQRCPCLA